MKKLIFLYVCMDGPPAQNWMTIFLMYSMKTLDDIQTEAYNPLFALSSFENLPLLPYKLLI